MENNESVVGKHIDYILNPHLQGLGSEICAGMICTEIARMLNPKIKINYYPALAGTADKVSGVLYEKYLRKSGYDKEFLVKWALAIDFEAYYMRLENVMGDLLSETPKRDKLIEYIDKEIKERFERWVKPEPKVTSGFLDIYRKIVSSAKFGAYFKI